MSCEERCQATTKTRSPRSRTAGVACALATVSLIVLLPQPSAAQQWLFTPEIEIGAHHVDNPRLSEDTEGRAITGGLLDAGLAFRRNTETSHVLLRPRVAIFRYTDAPDEDSEAYFLDFNADTESQRSIWRINANYRQQQVFRGETTSADFEEGVGLDDDVQTGTGRTFTRRQRDLWRLNPGVTFELTDVTSLDVDLSYLDVQYDQDELGEATDYTNSRVEAAIGHRLSRHSEISATVFAARYDPTNIERQTDSAGARVRYQQGISDISSFFVDIGVQESQAETGDPDFDISKTSFLWNLGLDRQLEVTHWRFEIGRRVTPSGSGSLVERDMVRAIMDHQLQPRLALRLAAVALTTDSVADRDIVGNNNARDYLQGRATLAYQWTRSWTVEGRYSLTHQDFADIPGDAQEHEIRLSFIYRPPLPTE